MDVLYCIVLCLFDTSFESYFDTALILFLEFFSQYSWQFFLLVILPAQEAYPQLKANATAQNVNFAIFTAFVSELVKNVNSNVGMNMFHFDVIQFFVTKENIYIYFSTLIYDK